MCTPIAPQEELKVNLRGYDSHFLVIEPEIVEPNHFEDLKRTTPTIDFP